LRRQEILKLAWRDLDLSEGTATILAVNTKTELMREVFLTKRTIEALRSLPTFGCKPNVFDSHEIKRCWNTARRLAGVADVRLHDLRATAATRMIEQHIPLEIVGKLLGDRNLVDVVYKHYIRINRPMIQDVRAQMDAYNAHAATNGDDAKNLYAN
jgi:integrase